MGDKGNGHGSPWDLSWSLENLRVAQTYLEAMRKDVEEWEKVVAAHLATVVEIQGAVNGAVGALDKACGEAQIPKGGKA